MHKKTGFLTACLAISLLLGAQLKPGFDKEEYIKLLRVSAQFGDSSYSKSLAPPPGYRMVYRSPSVGLDNRWQLWTNGTGTAIISIRGTSNKEASWLANFYAAMIPAKGELQLSTDYKFSYELSTHPKAAVHVGWTVALGFLIKDMTPKLDLLSRSTKDILIVGHSQGGAIAYLLTAYLHHLQLRGEFPKDIRIKTYCSAAPKPGNSYFAYEYESMTQGGWAFNVINAADWVPQTPFSVQGVNDFNEVNPFVNAKASIKKQSWPKRWALNYGYNKMTKPAKKALKNYQKYLGRFVSKSVKKNLHGFQAPAYYQSNDYVRTGTTIVLYPDDDYYKKYPQDQSKAFVNHLHQPYLYLADKLEKDGTRNAVSPPSLNGMWELNYLTESPEGVHMDKKPLLNFDVVSMRITGNTSCNIFGSTFKLDSNRISISENMTMTKMICAGDAESRFLNLLRKVNTYALDANTLTLLVDGAVVMRFVRKSK